MASSCVLQSTRKCGLESRRAPLMITDPSARQNKSIKNKIDVALRVREFWPSVAEGRGWSRASSSPRRACRDSVVQDGESYYASTVEVRKTANRHRKSFERPGGWLPAAGRAVL
jgi:hypothetical protein